MAVSLEQPEPSFESVVPMPIIPTAGTGYACGSQTPDGQRFLMSKIVDAPAEERDLDRSRRMIFVEHWFNELTRLAPPAEPTR